MPAFHVVHNRHDVCRCCSGAQGLEVVRRVVAGLDTNKRAIVESIGFGSMFHLPDVSDKHRLHSSFGSWLLSIFDAQPSSIVLDQLVRLPVSDETVRGIIGNWHTRCLEKNKIVEVVSRYLRI
jgi:hypothetical protein